MKYWLHPDAAAEHRKQPYRHRIVFPPAIRRVGFQVFRFDLIYREVNGDVQVLAIAGHRRQPNYWLSRL